MEMHGDRAVRHQSAPMMGRVMDTPGWTQSSEDDDAGGALVCITYITSSRNRIFIQSCEYGLGAGWPPRTRVSLIHRGSNSNTHMCLTVWKPPLHIRTNSVDGGRVGTCRWKSYMLGLKFCCVRNMHYRFLAHHRSPAWLARVLLHPSAGCEPG